MRDYKEKIKYFKSLTSCNICGKMRGNINFGDMRAGWMYDKCLGFPSLEVI